MFRVRIYCIKPGAASINYPGDILFYTDSVLRFYIRKAVECSQNEMYVQIVVFNFQILLLFIKYRKIK
jgi:hypothetical protein